MGVNEILRKLDILQEEVIFQLRYEEDLGNTDNLDMVTTLKNVDKLLDVARSLIDRPQI